MNAIEKKAYVEFKTRMARIAKKNGDEFKVIMESDEHGHHIEVIETADRHTFTDGDGATVEQAIADAMKNIPEALESWGYSDLTV